MLKITVVTILAVVFTVVDNTNACNSCPMSWMSLGHSCVKMFENKLTFDEAENACGAYRVTNCDGTALSTGHLVAIHSQDEQDVLVELVQTTLSGEVGGGWDPQVYIGMSVGSTNSDQTWTDGSHVAFTSWFPGEPNNAPNSRGVIAAGGYSQGNWADVYSDNRLPYICELPCLDYEVEA